MCIKNGKLQEKHLSGKDDLFKWFFGISIWVDIYIFFGPVVMKDASYLSDILCLLFFSLGLL